MGFSPDQLQIYGSIAVGINGGGGVLPVIRVWRICKTRWTETAFDGEGARLAGGRWNHRGERLVYTADSLALAAIELFVHLDPEDVPYDLVAVPAVVPESLSVEALELDALPAHWRQYPAPAALKELGSEWIRSKRSCALKVPSAVIPRESCYLLNPEHPDFVDLGVEDAEPFRYDPRMWR